jgi:hypothetical protein
LRLCSATTKAGSPCQRPAQVHNGLCIGHDPDKAAERRRTAARGGRGKSNPETRAVKNIKLRAIETERKLEEADVRREFEELKRELGLS